jgi:glycine/D-amino acid oxidase-like deaminating enzyme/glycine cleavage system aminomethyltransferase T
MTPVKSGIGATDAKVIVIGGGIAGCSAAYHLASLGMTDVVLLERAALSSGTTWHSTGNMETYRDDPLIYSMVRYAVESFPRLQTESGQDIGWRNVGRVMYTDREDRLEHFKTLPELGRVRGIELQLLSPDEVSRRLAIIDPQSLVGGLWVPSDGRVNPTDVVMAYGKAARARGVRIQEQVEVLEVTVRDGIVRGVVTNKGAIACDTVILAAGLWSSAIANSCGLKLPLFALEHQYIITKPIANLDRNMPLFLSYDDQLYGREEVGGLMVGSLDDHALAISTTELPQNFSFGLLAERWEQFEPYMVTAMQRFPVLRTVEIKMQLNGPESFTPDGQMLLGPIAGVDGLYSTCGFNSNGIALAPAAGKFIAEWIVDGAPSADVTPLDVRRFAMTQTADAYMRERVTEIPGYSCRLHVPGDDYETARHIRRSPVHAELASAGAHFASVAGWERPLWITVSAGKRPWIDCVDAEAGAASSDVLVVDRSADMKVVLVGPDIDTWLKARVAMRAPVSSSLANVVAFPGEHGEIAALGRSLPWDGGRLLTVGPEQETRLTDWMRKSRLPYGIQTMNVTSGWALFELIGPGWPAAVLALTLTTGVATPVNLIEVCWAGAVQIRVIADPIHASALLLLPADVAVYVWRRLLSTGTHGGLRVGGHYAQEALRIARGIPRFGQEATLGTRVAEILGPDPEACSGAIAAATHVAPIHRTPRMFAAFSSPARLPGFGSRDSIIHGDRTVGEVTSRVWLPGWAETLLLAHLNAEPPSLASLEMVADGRRWPLLPRRTTWQSGSNEPSVVG